MPIFFLNVAPSAHQVKATKHEARKQLPKRAPSLTDNYDFLEDGKTHLRCLYVIFIAKITYDQAEIA
jgi:hypothetical protein